MSFCKKCGAEIKENEKTCSACGQPTEQKSSFNNVIEEIKKLNDTADTTANYTQQEIDEGKGLSVVAYLGILVIIPIILAKNNRFVTYHNNQGLIFLLAGIIASVACVIMGFIPFVGEVVASIVGLIEVVLLIIGIVNAASGKAKELPVIGKFTLLK